MLTSLVNHSAPRGANEKSRLDVLEDKNSRGKERPWFQRKRQSLAVAKAFGELDGASPKTRERIAECGKFLRFAEFACNETGEVKARRLKSARFCGHRLCPMCQWRRSLLLHQQVCQVVEKHLEARPTDRALMLTLTVRNCSPDKLSKAITEVANAFRRLSDMAPVKRSVVGWFRSLEVTRNPMDGTMHPHVHVLLMVPEAYFDKRLSLYLETREWVALWRKALRADYDPVCDVRAVGAAKGGDKLAAMRKGLLEVTKYCTKPDDWIDFVDGPEGYAVAPQVLADLIAGLRYKRLVGWGGTFKDIYAELQLPDVEADEADLVGEEADEPAPEGCTFVGYASYSWFKWSNGGGNYYRKIEQEVDPWPPDRTSVH